MDDIVFSNQDLGTPGIDIENFLLKIFDLLRGGGGDVISHKQEILSAWHDFYYSFVTMSISISLLLIILIAYCLFRIHQIRSYEAAVNQASALWNREEISGGDISPIKKKWQQVEEHANSGDPNKWRLAILEADIILDEIVYDKFGDLGDTLGERLKKVDRSDFSTIDEAWEAHRMRNTIAHEGVAFEISERDMKHVINLYKNVFREFGEL